MCRRLPTVLLLLGALVALTPLAYASPPDPTWIAGLYDDADYDDVILAVMSAAGALEAAPLVLVAPVATAVGTVAPAGPPRVAGPSLRASQIRAPPAA